MFWVTIVILINSSICLVSPGGSALHEEDPRGSRGLECVSGRAGLPWEANRGLCPSLSRCAAHRPHWGAHTYQVDSSIRSILAVKLCHFNYPGTIYMLKLVCWQISGFSSFSWAQMEKLSSTMKLDAQWRPSWQMRWGLCRIKCGVRNRQSTNEMSTCLAKGRHLSSLWPSLPSAPDLPWCSVQGKRQRWPAGRDRWILGPGDCPAARRVGPLHPHRAS